MINQDNSILKSFGIDLEKARAGKYEDTPYNRKKGRVGQEFGQKRDKYEELGDIERKLNSQYIRSRNQEFYLESKRGAKLAERWRELMIELRGWDEYGRDDSGRDLTKQSWREYADKKKLAFNYTLGDVLA